MAANKGDSEAKTVPGGPNLMTPANQVVWFVKDENERQHLHGLNSFDPEFANLCTLHKNGLTVIDIS